MSNQDNIPPGDTNQPRDMTPDELEDALRWLEDLAGRQGKSLDGLISLDDTTLADSPFRGLFDSEEQDLPDWLREVPSGEEDLTAEGESRMDWLARFASRESVEELPTLEWRRMNADDDDEAGDLVDAMPETAAAVPGLPAVAEDRPPAVVEEMITLATAAAVVPDAPAEVIIEIAETAEVDAPVLIVTEEIGPPPTVTGGVSYADKMAMGPDDLDEAMAWLEELAASQDAPIEDLPSVADRALASKLIADAASGITPIDAAENSQMGIAMSGIYIGKTRLAPTGPLVGEAPADITPDSALFAEVTLANETADLSDPAMIAAAAALPEPEPSSTALPVLPAAVVAGSAIKKTDQRPAPIPTSPAATAVPASAKQAATAQPTLASLMSERAQNLPDMLTLVDQLAIPSATSLAEINSMLAADQLTARVTPFSLESTLDWLEGHPTEVAAVDPLDPALVVAMPDDPDEAQVWLEQLSGEVELESTPKGYVPTSAAAPSGAPTADASPATVDLSEADLLDMPEDPDAAIAWIENLAAKREGARS